MTTYRIARPDDLAAILRRYTVTQPLSWPTIVAYNGDEVVGFMSTHDDQSAVVAGPLESESPLITFRLIELYEAIMQGMGISEYLFYVENDKEPWIAQVKRVPGTETISQDERLTWFRRRLYGWRRQQST